MTTLYVYMDPFTFEGKVNARVREFLNTTMGYNTVVSRDLQSDDMPDIMVWSRIVGPAVEVSNVGYQYQAFQISVSSADLDGVDGRQRSSEIASLIQAFMTSQEFLGRPIINSSAGSGAYLTDSLDGFNRPAYTFNIFVYQTQNNLTI